MYAINCGSMDMEIFPNISKQDREKDQSFYVILTSTGARTSSDSLQFTCDLETPLVLEGSWCVGLSEIAFQHSWKKCVHSPYIRIFHSKYKKDYYNSKKEPHNFLDYCTNETPYVDIDISAIDYDSDEREKIMTQVNNKIASKMSRVFDRCTHPADDTTLYFEKIGVFDGISFEERKTLWFRVRNNKSMFQNLYSKVYIPPELAYLLGFESLICRQSRMSPKPEFVLSRVSPDYLNNPQTILIYSDVCEGSRINNSHGQILRWINIAKPFGAKIIQKYNPIHYLDVLKSKIYDITISVGGLCGHDLKSLFGETVLTLHFQKKSF